MDEIVAQALTKWPNVPHCYGWLALDARGNWRMRNEHAQTHKLPGDRITHPALIGFINRNYTHDAQGRWYFQNGPQRVYVELEATPYVAHTEPAAGFVLQTGAQLLHIEHGWLSEQGRLFLQGDEKIALLDDRDMAQCLAELQLDEQPVTDEQLMLWLEQRGSSGELSLRSGSKKIVLSCILEAAIGKQFNFIRTPQTSI
ncbi:Conserved hypothetical protein [Herminiimonas arsenicoxydans]|uniref:DUF2946 domain-containing protein n=1 Tax=Herminiimonas arsenicoxydans TaxID=204773 RepID=A4G8A0_HERAR|nr:Conserved hypothetical protein [Herminiimonas arsenicoxydans]